MKKIITCVLTSMFMLCSFLMPVSAKTKYVTVNKDEEILMPAASYDFVVNKSVRFKFDGDWYTEYFKLNVTQDLNGVLTNVYNVHDCRSTLPDQYYAITSIRSTTAVTPYKWKVFVEVSIYSGFVKEGYYYWDVEVSSAGPMLTK